eukprot:COSAG06_NODE_51091_length_314_cov_0.958140_2_plen_21_part_01
MLQIFRSKLGRFLRWHVPSWI